MATDNDRLLDALTELEAVGVGDLTTQPNTGESWASNTITIVDNTAADPNDPNFQPCGTSAGDLLINGDGTLQINNGDGFYDSFSGIGQGQATIQIGAMTLMASENGDVEIVIDADGLREEYHINADKVRNFLRSIADVVVEGKET